MLAVSDSCRRRGIGSVLVKQAVQRMRELKCVEVWANQRECRIHLSIRLGFEDLTQILHTAIFSPVLPPSLSSLDAPCVGWAGGQAMLETEVTNAESLRLYGRLGFARDEVGALCRLALKHFLDFKQPQQHENARAMNFVL